MATMKATRTLRDAPNGAPKPPGVIADFGLQVQILEAKDSWTHVKLLGGVVEPDGWVSSDAVDTADAPVPLIDKNAFARACWRQALFFGVNPHYMASIAELRSRVTADKQDDQFGPFCLTQAEWEANRKSPDFDLVSADIADWRAQCIVFARMVADIQKEFDQRDQEPLANSLFLAQMLGMSAFDLLKDPNKAINLGPSSDALKKRFSPFLDGATGKAVLDRLNPELKKALDSVAPMIEQVGKEILDDPDLADNVLKDPDSPTKPADVKFADGDFNAKAPGIMTKLMADFNLTEVQAAAILGNIGHECAGFRLLQEVSPVGGGRGGWGWCQWTGSRRVAFENFCTQQSLQPASDVANYGFLNLELKTTHKSAISALKATTTLSDGVRAFEREFERAGIKHYESRDKWAKRALEAFQAKGMNSGLSAAGSVVTAQAVGNTVKVPEDWMPSCEMLRIICHWTAGAYKASAHDRESYHILIEKNGNLVRGDLSIADNLSTADGTYAHHTLSCNTKSIGITVCCMANAQDSPAFVPGPCPMTQDQWELLAQVAAQLAKRYNIPVTPRTILGHGEVQKNLGITQKGKWDPMVLPWDATVPQSVVGDRFRTRVSALLAIL